MKMCQNNGTKSVWYLRMEERKYMGEDESKKILSNDWKELIVEDEKTKE